jgi:uncharacterized protein YcfJ
MALVSLFFQTRAKLSLMELDASLQENHEASATPTENEVEDGAKISDHITLSPLSLSIEGVVSENPISLISSAIGAVAGLIGKQVGKNNGAVAGAAATVGVATVGGLVSGAFSGGGPKSRKKEDVFTYLLELRDRRQPFTVVTGLKEYDNMVITQVSVPRNSQTGEVLRFSVQLKQIKIIKTSLIEIAIEAAKAGAAKAQNVGKQAAKQTTEKTAKDSSLLFKGFKFFGG